MTNKGYYGWIHSLKNAAFESQRKGFEMLNEEKAKKITSAESRANLAKALGREINTPQKTSSLGNLPIEDKESGTFEDMIVPGESSISSAGGDVGELAKIIASRSQKDSKPVDVNMDGKVTANDVAMDAGDNKIDGMALPQDRVHPEPWYKTPEEANAAARELTDYYGNADDGEPNDDDELRRLSVPTANWRNVRENKNLISKKIQKFLN